MIATKTNIRIRANCVVDCTRGQVEAVWPLHFTPALCPCFTSDKVNLKAILLLLFCARQQKAWRS